MGCAGSKPEDEAPKVAPNTAAANISKASQASAPTETPPSNEVASVPTQSVGDKHLTGGAKSRLSIVEHIVVPEVKSKMEETRVTDTKNLFGSDVVKGPAKSKIYAALNPEKLAYESRREKEEAANDTWTVEIRGGGKTKHVADYAKMEDADGNLVNVLAEDEEEEEEEVDVANLPTFGEFEVEMKQKRQEREQKLQEKQASLKKEWEAKKAAEQAETDKELAKIKAKQDAQKKLEALELEKTVRDVSVRLNNSDFEFDFKFKP